MKSAINFLAGCLCPICSYWIQAPYLKTKKITGKHKKRAQKLKVDYLTKLFLHHDLPINTQQVSVLVSDSETTKELALLAYTDELLKRIEGHKEGPALLALWREFAWDDSGSPIKAFKLLSTMILKLEEKIIDLIQERNSF